MKKRNPYAAQLSRAEFRRRVTVQRRRQAARQACRKKVQLFKKTG